MNPAPNLTNEFLDWGFVLAVLAAWAVIELALFVVRWRAESRRMDDALAAMDELSQGCDCTGKWVK